AAAGATNDDPDAPIQLGSGGGDNADNGPSGYGGAGGGALRLIVDDQLVVDGVVTADGASGVGGEQGGGAGGSVFITARNLGGAGRITARGGDGVSSGGGGGGGRVAIEYSRTSNFLADNVDVRGGAGSQAGGVGTSVWHDLRAASSGGPRIVGLTPPGHSNNRALTAITVDLSTAVVADATNGANSPDTYSLIGLGADRVRGGNDDSVVPLTPSYTAGATQIRLTTAAPLTEGLYQLEVHGGATSGLRDATGRPLDANGDSLGDDLFTTLNVDFTAPIVTSITALSSDPVRFAVQFADVGGMSSASIGNAGNYKLVASGGDGVFGNANDVDLSSSLSVVSADESTLNVVLGLPAPTIADYYRLTVNGVSGIVDRAGNRLLDGVNYTSGSLSIIDRPTSVSIDLQAASDTGASSTDHLTKLNTPTFDVTANNRGVIDVDFDGDGFFDLSRSLAASGTVAVTSPIQLADGPHQVRVRFTPWVGPTAESTTNVTIDTVGPRAVVTPQSVVAPYYRRQVTFNEAIDSATFAPSDASVTSGGQQTRAATSVTGGGASYSVEFDPINASGAYSLIAGPNIADLAGNLMDQNADRTTGQSDKDQFVDSFRIEG
ncbi:MAG TPA: Ig-like domain-containing protein, partial [Pirellulaceae bacterium]|nr:Ig-like domain-containing protein [Pirellulaceae bacterium]